jgi:hypothetical protein
VAACELFDAAEPNVCGFQVRFDFEGAPQIPLQKTTRTAKQLQIIATTITAVVSSPSRFNQRWEPRIRKAGCPTFEPGCICICTSERRERFHASELNAFEFLGAPSFVSFAKGGSFSFFRFFSLHSFLFLPPMRPANSVHPSESNSALPSRVESVAAPCPNKRKNQNPPPFANDDEGWGTLKVHFKNKGNDKAIANHRSVNYRSGIISLDARSIADSMDASGRATRQS